MSDRCPNCNLPIPRKPTGVQTHTTPRRPGGPQVSFSRGVRILAAFLVDEGYVASESRAQRVAARWLRAALPERQKRPRSRSALKEAA